jgi:hypothetical protein
LDRRRSKRGYMVLYVLQSVFHRKLQEGVKVWRQWNPEYRMYMDVKKLMNQKNYIMKTKSITEMEIEEGIARKLEKSLK